MKKLVLILSVIFASVTLLGCNNSENNEPNNVSESESSSENAIQNENEEVYSNESEQVDTSAEDQLAERLYGVWETTTWELIESNRSLLGPITHVSFAEGWIATHSLEAGMTIRHRIEFSPPNVTGQRRIRFSSYDLEGDRIGVIVPQTLTFNGYSFRRDNEISGGLPAYTPIISISDNELVLEHISQGIQSTWTRVEE